VRLTRRRGSAILDGVADISITPAGEHAFQVRVDGQTLHRVTVPQPLIDDLGDRAADLERVVRVSFEFLLEREPATSILPEFSLDVIGRYFPEYERELPRRLG